VIKKFGDDRAGNLAALIAYYGFFSMFPLLLVFVTVVSFVARGNPQLQQRIVDSALSQFPVIGHQIANNVHALKGSTVALTLGVVGALWGGMGVVQAAQNAMNAVWNVPYKQQPNLLKSRLRALIMLGVLGAAVIGSVVLSGLGSSGGGLGVVLKVIAVVAGFALNLGLFLAAYRVLTVEELSWADVFPGAIIAAALWSALQYLGTYYVGHQLKSASEIYGFFAVVIGLLSWIYIGAQLTLLCAEINVVRKRRLWPRSLVQPPLTEPDKRALELLAKEEERRPEEKVEVRFSDPPGSGSSSGSSSGSATAR
jgi:membrane protein